MPKYGKKPKASAGYGSGMKRSANGMSYGGGKKKRKMKTGRKSYK